MFRKGGQKIWKKHRQKVSQSMTGVFSSTDRTQQWDTETDLETKEKARARDLLW